jgi:hypothetical protein
MSCAGIPYRAPASRRRQGQRRRGSRTGDGATRGIPLLSDQQDVGRALCKAEPAAIMEEINASIDFDKRKLAAMQDIAGSKRPCRNARRARHHLAQERWPTAIARRARTAIEGEIAGGTASRSRASSRIFTSISKQRLARVDRARRRGVCTPPARATTRWRLDLRLWVRGQRCERARDGQLRRAASCAARRGLKRMRRNDHARLHPYAGRAACHLRPSLPCLCRDAGARPRAFSPMRASA